MSEFNLLKEVLIRVKNYTPKPNESDFVIIDATEEFPGDVDEDGTVSKDFYINVGETADMTVREFVQKYPGFLK